MEEHRPRKLDRDALWTYALKALAGRAYSTGELREKLKRRAAKAADIENVISSLKDYRYLDDRRFAEGFATARLSNDKFGRTRVIQDLRQHRVAPSLAESVVGNVYRDTDEQALIDEWIRRKYRDAEREGLFGEEKEMAAAYRRLLRAGFRSGEIIRALKKFARNPELLDGFEPPAEEEI
jgi:regulatory protein